MATNSVLTDYAYELPDELVAATPIEPRDSSRLFVYDAQSDSVTFDSFANLASHLPIPALLVFNDTKVVPARLDLKKETGGRVECLLLMNELQPGDPAVRALVDRKITVGQKLFADFGHAFEAISQDGNQFLLKPLFDIAELPELLDRVGRTPIPKYLGRSGLSEQALRSRYQTVWAKRPASVAAPTASLHFSPAVLQSLSENNIDTTEVSLHVGMGTFAPVTGENLSSRRLHKEYYRIPAAAREKIVTARQTGRKVVAVGTTATRALEAAATQILDAAETGDIDGSTELFILPPHQFRIPDALITNFHLPQSSLMCLVESFLRHKRAPRTLLDLYQIAIREKFRFYSFGDAMLIK